MNRLRFILALSHASLGLGLAALYMNPESLFVGLVAVGGFVRWMVPSKSKPIEGPMAFFVIYGLASLLTHWLMDCGLSEVIENAWHDRLSIRPVIFFSSILLFLIAKDWVYFEKLSPREVDEFYKTKKQGA